MQINVNDRLNIGGEFCTVRYIGSLPEWPNTVAYGLEWDNTQRGKHDGTLNGVRYFRTSDGESSGSFVKETKLDTSRQERTSFEDALLMKYGDTSSIDITYKFGSKETESYGFEHLNEMNSDFDKLESITLSENNIFRAFKTTSSSIPFNSAHSSLRYLDLSFNLFSDINEVYRILRLFPSVETVILSGNCFTKLKADSSEQFEFSNVKELSMACCKLRNGDIETIIELFPQIKVLDISSNLLSKLPDVLSSLQEINISDNLFIDFPKVLSRESSLTSVDISENKISELNDLNTNSHIMTLRIDRNRITNWEEIDSINTVFPKLETLWIKKNPVCFEDTQKDFYSIIARVKSLKCVDGTRISEDIRNEAELYFVSLVLSFQINYDTQSAMWDHLTLKHSINTDSRTTVQQTNFLSKELIEVPIVYDSEPVKLKLLKSFSVRYLKTFLRYKFNLQGEISMQYSVMDNIKHDFTNEFSPLATYNIEESTIYIKSK
ncbi:Pac2 [Kluyveromyces lactis]|nr:Pac2 [Kluyveromyces lactis]